VDFRNRELQRKRIHSGVFFWNHFRFRASGWNAGRHHQRKSTARIAQNPTISFPGVGRGLAPAPLRWVCYIMSVLVNIVVSSDISLVEACSQSRIIRLYFSGTALSDTGILWAGYLTTQRFELCGIRRRLRSPTGVCLNITKTAK
jgi:hypothetical protein